MKSKLKICSFFFLVLCLIISVISCDRGKEIEPENNVTGHFTGISEIIAEKSTGSIDSITFQIVSDNYFTSKETFFIRHENNDILITKVDETTDIISFLIKGSLILDPYDHVMQYFGYVNFNIFNGPKYHGKYSKKEEEIVFYLETDYVNDSLDSLNAIYMITAIKTNQ